MKIKYNFYIWQHCSKGSSFQDKFRYETFDTFQEAKDEYNLYETLENELDAPKLSDQPYRAIDIWVLDENDEIILCDELLSHVYSLD